MTELAYGSVLAHTLLDINNREFSKTSVSGQTLVVSEEYILGVVVVDRSGID